MEKTYYIVRAALSGGFWTGSGWSEEYPNAELFQTKEAAKVSAKRAAFTATAVEVIADYALTTERVVATVRR